MAESNVIREFLVALGYKHDETSLKKFTSGIETATKTVVLFATTLEATALAVAAGVSRFASNLEALYFASQRVGASAANLKALDVAAQNFGASSGEALQAVEALAKFLRSNPGGEAFLGVTTRDAKGNLRDMTDILVDLGRKWATMPTYLGSQYAGIFGISDKMFLALRNGDFAKELARVRAEVDNSAFKKATADAHGFMMQLRDLELYLLQFAVRVEDALTNRLGISVKGMTEYLRDHGKELADKLVDVLMKLFDLVERLRPAFVWLYNKFIELDEATNGWSTKLLLLMAALKWFGGAEIISGVLGLAAAFGRLALGIGGATTAATALGTVGMGLGLGYLIQKYVPGWADFFGQIGGKIADYGNRAPDALRYFQDMGWKPHQAAALVANLMGESGLNPSAVGDHGQAVGIAQWHPDRQAAFARWAGFPLTDLRADRQKQLEFVNYELTAGSERTAGALLRATTNTEQANSAVYRSYERAGAGAEEEARRGRAAANLVQTNTFNIQSTDPTGAGREVAGHQGRLNTELTRNLQTVVQ
jgi:hypothetical protein